MPSLFASLAAALALTSAVTSSALPRHAPFEQVKQKRQSTSSNLTVDLGYEIYQGVSDTITGLNTWKGIRYAAPPTGSLRWQAPQVPTYNRSNVIQANSFGSQCPQSSYAATGEISNSTPGSEDCLFLNVYSPANASDLPVLVWIHGGGYGLGNGQQDMTDIINTNNNTFVAVSIQYRLGAFGFLSSDELYRNGVVNAGILDQHFSLQWVQSFISQFGGNASQVTISGESAGAGSVMLQDMAYGGTLGESLFVNTIAASPYLPMQYGYSDWVPSQSYYAFANMVGCFPNTAYGSSSGTIFDCLVAANTTTLQEASANVSASGTFGSWGFLPVTDGIFIQQTPSQQLLKKQVNGRNLLIGNNANEGPLFTTPNITTETDLIDWVHLVFPLFTNNDIAKLLFYYPSSNTSATTTDYATLGYTGPSALNQSNIATGQQQRADNIYAESTFVCPSYWMAEAYSDNSRNSYKYQYSVLPALHGTDVTAYFGPAVPYQSPAFQKAFMAIWGNFITGDNPSISAGVANATGDGKISDWPPFTSYAPYQINLNQTGGEIIEIPDFVLDPYVANVTALAGPGLANNFGLFDAYTWEDGRGMRCDFWRAVAAIVPE